MEGTNLVELFHLAENYLNIMEHLQDNTQSLELLKLELDARRFVSAINGMKEDRKEAAEDDHLEKLR